MNALISQQGHDDDFARGHAVAPTRKFTAYCAQTAREKEDRLIKGMEDEARKAREAAREYKSVIPKGLGQREATKQARKISAQWQRDRSQAEIYNALLDHGPMTTQAMESVLVMSSTSIHRYCGNLADAGMVGFTADRAPKSGAFRKVWHVVAAQ